MSKMQLIKFRKKDLKKFSFEMNYYCCWKLRTGDCPLEKKEIIEISKNPHEHWWHYYEEKGCVEVAACLKEKGYKKKFIIEEHSCGHITLPDGQHRVCVGIRLGLEIPIEEYIKVEYKCPKCRQNIWKRFYSFYCNFKVRLQYQIGIKNR